MISKKIFVAASVAAIFFFAGSYVVTHADTTGCLQGQATCTVSNGSCPDSQGETQTGCMSPWGCVPMTNWPACTAPVAATSTVFVGPGISGTSASTAGTSGTTASLPANCAMQGSTQVICTGTNAGTANGVSTSVIAQSQDSCLSGTEQTISPSGETQGQCQAIISGKTTTINYCLGTETSGPCAAERIDLSAAEATAQAEQNLENGAPWYANETCHAQQYSLPTPDINTGLDYFYQTVCTPNGSSGASATTNSGTSGAGSTSVTTGGSGSASGFSTGGGSGSTAAAGTGISSVNATLSSALQSTLSSLQNLSGLTGSVSATGNTSATTGSTAGGSINAQSLLAALEASLQNIEASLTANQSTLSQSTISGIESVLTTIAQMIQALEGSVTSTTGTSVAVTSGVTSTGGTATGTGTIPPASAVCTQGNENNLVATSTLANGLLTVVKTLSATDPTVAGPLALTQSYSPTLVAAIKQYGISVLSNGQQVVFGSGNEVYWVGVNPPPIQDYNGVVTYNAMPIPASLSLSSVSAGSTFIIYASGSGDGFNGNDVQFVGGNGMVYTVGNNGYTGGAVSSTPSFLRIIVPISLPAGSYEIRVLNNTQTQASAELPITVTPDTGACGA